MTGLPHIIQRDGLGPGSLAQLGAPSGAAAGDPGAWWWSTLTSGPALLLLALAAGCAALLLFLGWRLRRVSAQRQPATLRERLSDDSGVAMIEFVLVTPVLLFLTLLLVQTMLVFTGLFYVQYAAFAGARSAIVHIPTQSTEGYNQIVAGRGSAKFDAIESAAMIAVMPVSGRESGGVLAGPDIVNGLSEMYRAQGKPEPAWVQSMLAERLNYAINHTEVVLEKVTPGAGLEQVVYEEASGLTEFSPKEAISVRVRHEFALTIPLASKVFTAAGESGSYTPASASGSDSPGVPGYWTMIESRAILTNEGIDRRLPEEPSLPRR